MYTLNNLIESISDKVFSMTGFNYDISEDIHNDGTVSITFDCDADADKFERIYNSIK